MSDKRLVGHPILKRLDEWLTILVYCAGVYFVGRAIHLRFGDTALLAYQGLIMIFVANNRISNERGR